MSASEGYPKKRTFKWHHCIISEEGERPRYYSSFEDGTRSLIHHDAYWRIPPAACWDIWRAFSDPS